MTITDARVGIRNGEFKEGSMLPKVEASVSFAKKTGKKAIITSLNKAKEALDGKLVLLFTK